MTDWPSLIGAVAALLVAAGGFWRNVKRTDRLDQKVETVKTELTQRVDQAEAGHLETRRVINRFVEESRAAAASRTRRITDVPGATIDQPAVAAATAAATTAATAATAAASVATTAIESLKTEDRESRREEIGIAAAQLLVELADRTKEIAGDTRVIADHVQTTDDETKT